MRISALFLLGACSVMVSCSGEKNFPPAPSSLKAVETFVQGKKMKAAYLAFYAPVVKNGQKTLEEIRIQDQPAFLKTHLEKDAGLGFNFGTDGTLTVLSDKKETPGTYVITGNDDRVVLEISYAFEEDGKTMEGTFSYPVAGMDENRFLLETPREINSKKVLVMMTVE